MGTQISTVVRQKWQKSLSKYQILHLNFTLYFLRFFANKKKSFKKNISIIERIKKNSIKFWRNALAYHFLSYCFCRAIEAIVTCKWLLFYRMIFPLNVVLVNRSICCCCCFRCWTNQSRSTRCLINSVCCVTFASTEFIVVSFCIETIEGGGTAKCLTFQAIAAFQQIPSESMYNSTYSHKIHLCIYSGDGLSIFCHLWRFIDFYLKCFYHLQLRIDHSFTQRTLSRSNHWGYAKNKNIANFASHFIIHKYFQTTVKILAQINGYFT